MSLTNKPKMSSNLKIERKCQLCGSKFIAKTTVTKFCGEVCGKKAYKIRKMNEKIEKSKLESVYGKIRETAVLPVGDYLTVKEAALLLKCSPRTIHRMVEKNQIPFFKLGERGTRIRRVDVETLFLIPALNPETNLNDYYSMSEVMEKYGISEKALYDLIKRNEIPKIPQGKFVYVPRIMVDKILN